MARRFVSTFLLPLVRGGTLEVGRPVAGRDVISWADDYDQPTLPAWEQDAVTALSVARRCALLPLVAAPGAQSLDEATWRLGGAVHNLLAMSHPRIGGGARAESRVERVAALATSLAHLGAPTTMGETLARHSLLARLPDVARFDHTVRFWLGHRTFVGRRPPARMLALPRLRNVAVETVRRTWLRDVGVQAAARPAFAALTEASPLGEALDPLRLDPSWSWGRVLSILRFPVLCRLVAGRLVALGRARTGDALTEALYRYVSLQDTAGPVAASPESAAFALSFLAHLAWLDFFFQSNAEPGGAVPPARASLPAGGAANGGPDGEAGRELSLLLAVALRRAPHLIWPADVPADGDVGRGFAGWLERLFAHHQVAKNPRWPAAEDLVRLAEGGARPRWAGNAV